MWVTSCVHSRYDDVTDSLPFAPGHAFFDGFGPRNPIASTFPLQTENNKLKLMLFIGLMP